MLVICDPGTGIPHELVTTPDEPSSEGGEDDLPQSVRDGIEVRHEHASHGSSHEDMRYIDVAMSRARPSAGCDETADAVERDSKHQPCEKVVQPTRVGHVKLLRRSALLGRLKALHVGATSSNTQRVVPEGDRN